MHLYNEAAKAFLMFFFFFFFSFSLPCRDEARSRIQRDYLSDPNYNYETVNRASKACGPLVKWAIAQVSCMPVYCGSNFKKWSS